MADGWARVSGPPRRLPGDHRAGRHQRADAGRTGPSRLASRCWCCRARVEPSGQARGTIHDLPDQRAPDRSGHRLQPHDRRSTSSPTRSPAPGTCSSRRGRGRCTSRCRSTCCARRPASCRGRARPRHRRSPEPGAAARPPTCSPARPAGACCSAAARSTPAPRRCALAERLDAPIGLTINARGTVPSDHPLCVGVGDVLSAGQRPAAGRRRDAGCRHRVLGARLVVPGRRRRGCRRRWCGSTSTPASSTSRPCTPPARRRRRHADRRCARLLRRAAAPQGDAGERVSPTPWPTCAGRPTYRRSPPAGGGARPRRCPDDRIVAADSTQPAYAANHAHARPAAALVADADRLRLARLCAADGDRRQAGRARAARWRRWPATAACCSRCQELATARDLGLAIPLVVWNNDGYGEIRDSMQRVGIDADRHRRQRPRPGRDRARLRLRTASARGRHGRGRGLVGGRSRPTGRR